MNLQHQALLLQTRRQFFGRAATGIGAVALSAMLGETGFSRGAMGGALKSRIAPNAAGGLPSLPNFAPRAKRAIYLHMVGAPPQQDLFDYKPKMTAMFNKDLPESIRQGQRLTTMTSGQSRFPIAPSVFKFAQHGQCGAWMSDALPWTAKMVDDLTIIRSMNTDAINHEPAMTFAQTGNQVPGRPCIGSWIAYGLGSMNSNLPTFVVLNASHSDPRANVQAISSRLWSAGFLSAQYAGVALRTAGDPVLYIKNPQGVDTAVRRKMLDGLDALNRIESAKLADPETNTRIAQYEMAFRMQASVPELTDLSQESESTYALYGPDAKKAGTFANTALLARRLVERGVRFVQIYHRGWDVHGNLPAVLPNQCRDVDQASYALVQDLKARGMLDDTLVIWGGEFGRTVYSQGALTATDYGRDHHPRCYTLWMAGGGVKGGLVYGETDDFSYNIVANPVHVHDWHATLLHLLGINHSRFTYQYQGLDQRLSGVEPARVVGGIFA
ncbi:MAG TPA: DUF1501 domain-containing protein [Tepidisphaeraceae bacterium]|nr:DUF1501 domain-containing protein [Tepidisphaeraceae bacterium]